MTVPGKLLELANKNPIVCNGVQLHLCGAASLETAMVAIIAALVEANDRQQEAHFKELQSRHPTYLNSHHTDGPELQ
jgi:uncharacterized protein (UPF0276 family)